MLINRIGDFFILGGILLIFSICKSVDFFVVFSQFNLYLEKFIIFYIFRCRIVDLICLLLFLGAITKSAQIFFHGWLPDAMEGPTPVSALIHAATMVTAGIFLIIRCSYIFEYSPVVLELSVYFGVVTIVTFSLIGLFQNDIKKVIAYSTCSQLGYMILSCGLSSYNFALFHLFNHAFFKALLFLSAGSIIHFMNNEQDLRRLNGVFHLLPITSVCVIIGSLSLSGFPFMSGFYSKDAILEILFYKYKSLNIFIFLLAEIGVALTSLYSLKIIYYLLFKRNFNYLSNFKRFRINYNFVNNFTMFNFSQYFPLFFLAVFSIFSGFFFKNLFLGLGENFFFNSIFILPVNQTIDFEFISYFSKLTTMFFVFVSLIIF
jgi:NADH-quinone oxidoreductase subunit L